MKDKKTQKKTKENIRIIVMVALATIVVKTIWNLKDIPDIISYILSITSVFIVGLFIAYMINPLVDWFNFKVFKGLFHIKNNGIRKALGIVFAYATILSIIVACMIFIIPQIIDSLTQLQSVIDSAQTGYNKIVKYLEKLNESHPQWKVDSIINMINDIPNKIDKYAGNVIVDILPKVYDTSVSIVKGFLNFIIAIIVSIYMLFDKARLINSIKMITYAILPEKKADRLNVVAAECNRIFGSFIIGKLIDSTIIGFMCFVIMSVLDIPYALVISIFVGITNMIPYFGPFIGAVPGILLLLVVDFYYAIIFAIIILCLQQFDGWFLGPKILGESTGLRPIWIIFAILVGGSLGGVLGMFLGVPVTAVIAYLLTDVIDRKLKVKRLSFEKDPDTDILTKEDLITEDKDLEVEDLSVEETTEDGFNTANIIKDADAVDDNTIGLH